MRALSRSILLCFTAATTLSCASRGVGSAAATSERLAALAEGCYVGAAYLFVDSTVEARVRRDFPQWLVLERADALAEEGPGGGGRLVVGDTTPVYRVAWTVRGDSIHIDELTFPAARWILARTPSGFAGRAIFQGDMVLLDANGRPVPERTEWPAALRRIPCDAVPASAD